MKNNIQNLSVYVSTNENRAFVTPTKETTLSTISHRAPLNRSGLANWTECIATGPVAIVLAVFDWWHTHKHHTLSCASCQFRTQRLHNAPSQHQRQQQQHNCSSSSYAIHRGASDQHTYNYTQHMNPKSCQRIGVSSHSSFAFLSNRFDIGAYTLVLSITVHRRITHNTHDRFIFLAPFLAWINFKSTVHGYFSAATDRFCRLQMKRNSCVVSTTTKKEE